MKKVLPIVAVVLLLIVAGFFLKGTKKPGTSLLNKPEGNVFNSIKDALSKSLSLKCVYKDEQGVQTTTYIKGGAVRVIMEGIKDKEQPLTSEEYIKYIKEIIKKYLLLVIIDPLEANDLIANKNFSEDIKTDFYLASEKQILFNQITTAVLKLNEIGTITEFFDQVIKLKTNKLNYIISAGHGETNDDFVADLSVALQAEFIKFGPPVHSENVTKYNRLLDIEKELKLS